jgi:hypothetical protein
MRSAGSRISSALPGLWVTCPTPTMTGMRSVSVGLPFLKFVYDLAGPVPFIILISHRNWRTNSAITE